MDFFLELLPSVLPARYYGRTDSNYALLLLRQNYYERRLNLCKIC